MDDKNENKISAFIPISGFQKVYVSVILDKGPGKAKLLKVKKADYYNNELVIVAKEESEDD